MLRSVRSRRPDDVVAGGFSDVTNSQNSTDVAFGVGTGLIMIVAMIGAKLKYDVNKRTKSNSTGEKIQRNIIFACNLYFL